MSMISKVGMLAATVVVVAFSGAAEAYQCKTQPESVVLAGANQPTAQALGKAAWTTKVKGKFGLEWSLWSIAAATTQVCGPAGAGFQCTTVAKPCKYVVQ